MHERTNRVLCRIAFLVICLAPTVGIASWAAVRNTPQYRAAERARWEQALRNELGLTVAIDRVSEPNAGTSLLEGVEFREPETGRVLATIRVAEVVPRENGWLLLASQPEVQADAIDSLWRAFHDRLMVRTRAHRPLWMHCGELTLVSGEQSQTLTDVQFQFSADKKGPLVGAEFRLAGELDGRPSKLTIYRDRDGSEPQTILQLVTGDASLPCSVLEEHVPGLRILGKQCRFRGELAVSLSRSGWSGDLREAVFEGVDLNELVTSRFSHTLRGSADIALQDVQFRRGRLLRFHGEATSDSGGVISRSLLASLEQELGVALAPRVAESERTLWKFRQLSCQFLMDESGLAVKGGCGGDAFQGAMMLDETGPLLYQPKRPTMPVVALVRALAPQSDIQVPASVQSAALIQALPVPDIKRAAPERPESPLRLK